MAAVRPSIVCILWHAQVLIAAYPHFRPWLALAMDCRLQAQLCRASVANAACCDGMGLQFKGLVHAFIFSGRSRTCRQAHG